MNRTRMIVVAALAVLLLGGAGLWLYDQVQGDTQAASGPITAIPLELPTTAPATEAPAAVAATTAPTEAATEAPTATEAATEAATATSAPTDAATVEATATEAATEAPTVAATAAPTAEATAAPTEAPAASGVPNTMLRFAIVPEGTTATFTLQEDLNGQRVTVVGTTNQVVGELAVNPSDLSTAQVGVIQINARTLATDTDRRDRAIRNFILNTDQYEYITFKPTAIQGLSGAASADQSVSFQIVGDLTIRDVTRSVTFNATAQAGSAERLTGTARTTVNRADYNLQIPSVPFVANVSEEVQLDLVFTAVAQ